MEGNDLNNTNQPSQETQSNESNPNHPGVSDRMNEASLSSNNLLNNDNVSKDTSIDVQKSTEKLTIQSDNPPNTSPQTSINSSNIPSTNNDSNQKKNQQPKGSRTRLRNSAASNNPVYFQSQLTKNNSNLSARNTRVNNTNLNLNVIPTMGTNNSNSNPNSSIYPPSNISNTSNITSLNSSSPSLSPASTNKKDKFKEKKGKNIKKIKDKKEKAKTKKYHKNNKMKGKLDSDSDNDDKEWSRTVRHNSSTGSERSVRRNTELLHQQASGNPLDIWIISLPFFQPLTAKSEIEELCSDIEMEMTAQKPSDTSKHTKNDDQTAYKNERSNTNTVKKHWSIKMSDAVINTINASSHNSSKGQKNVQIDSDQILSRNSSNSSINNNDFSSNDHNLYNKKKNSTENLYANHQSILFPPGPSPNSSDMASYWNDSVQEFPVTNLQMQNYSIMHSLLSAFVPAEPDKNHDDRIKNMMVDYESPFSFQKEFTKTNGFNSDLYSKSTSNNFYRSNDFLGDANNAKHKISNNNEEATNNNQKDIDEQDQETDYNYLPTHVPAPQLEFNDYLSHNFEERLIYELQSAGIKQPNLSTNLLDNYPNHSSNPLDQEINKYYEELKKIQPQINQIKQEVISNYEYYENQDDNRSTELFKYNQLMPRKFYKK